MSSLGVEQVAREMPHAWVVFPPFLFSWHVEQLHSMSPFLCFCESNGKPTSVPESPWNRYNWTPYYHGKNQGSGERSISERISIRPSARSYLKPWTTVRAVALGQDGSGQMEVCQVEPDRWGGKSSSLCVLEHIACQVVRGAAVSEKPFIKCLKIVADQWKLAVLYQSGALEIFERRICGYHPPWFHICRLVTLGTRYLRAWAQILSCPQRARSSLTWRPRIWDFYGLHFGNWCISGYRPEWKLEGVNIVVSYCGHEPLESGRRVLQAHGHYKELEMSVFRLKRISFSVFWCDEDLVETCFEVQFWRKQGCPRRLNTPSVIRMDAWWGFDILLMPRESITPCSPAFYLTTKRALRTVGKLALSFPFVVVRWCIPWWPKARQVTPVTRFGVGIRLEPVVPITLRRRPAGMSSVRTRPKFSRSWTSSGLLSISDKGIVWHKYVDGLLCKLCTWKPTRSSEFLSLLRRTDL